MSTQTTTWITIPLPGDDTTTPDGVSGVLVKIEPANTRPSSVLLELRASPTQRRIFQLEATAQALTPAGSFGYGGMLHLVAHGSGGKFVHLFTEQNNNSAANHGPMLPGEKFVAANNGHIMGITGTHAPEDPNYDIYTDPNLALQAYAQAWITMATPGCATLARFAGSGCKLEARLIYD